MNVHLTYRGTPYDTGFARLKARLLEARIRHFRDGAVDDSGGFAAWDAAARFAELGRAGLRGTFIFNRNVSPGFVRGFPARVAPAFGAYENTNEANWGGAPADWAALTRLWMPTFYGFVKGDPATAAYPVLGPSLVVTGGENPYRTLGDMSAHLDAGNIHPYFAGFHPGTPGWGDRGAPPCQAYPYGALDWSVCNARATSGTKPIVVTETGYGTNAAVHGQVTRAVQAKYTGRSLLLMFNAGIQRSFVYELIDLDAGYWGILDRDLAPKPAYREIASLLALADEPAPAAGLAQVDLALIGNAANVHRTLLQKADGTFLLALWIEKSSFDGDARGLEGAGRPVAVPSQAIRVRLPATVSQATAHRFKDNGRYTSKSLTGTPASGGRAFDLRVTDNITVLAFRPG